MAIFNQPFLSGGFPSMNRAVAAGAVGGWVELGRTTLGSAGDTITVSSIADKRYYMILGDLQDTGGNINTLLRFNSDAGSNYAYRYSDDGGTDSALTSQGDNRIWIAEQSAPIFHVGYAANRSANEKLVINHSVTEQAAGEATAPSRMEFTGKWDNTSNAIDTVSMINSKAGSYNTGSEVVVLGWDPADTHTNNFWTELADASWSSGSSFDTGTFTAKKYLWVQGWVDSATTNYYPLIDVGNGTLDTGSNYALRRSYDGATDVTSTSRASWEIEMSGTASPKYFNLFIINNASNEKLGIMHAIAQLTAGAGTAPSRRETVCKWDNTSNQINIIGLKTTTGDFTGGQIKVWGAD